MTGFNQRSPRSVRRSLALVAVVSLGLSSGCAQMFKASPSEPVARAMPALPEIQNEQRYAKPVTETEVVQIFGYPVVQEFESRNL